MPRGGGFGGGGFRGGGFGGGGFRGGGFGGGGFSGRGWSGGYRPGGMPFGRTGARRTVSGARRGPYSHGFYGPNRRYYRYGYFPWYRRWWYSPYWSGYWYRPWYYSPAYIGGGIVFAIILALIILPIAGVAFLYPFSNADINGNVNYRSTEYLNYNEYWYEYEYVKDGQIISYEVSSSISTVSFAFWDQPFTNLPTYTRTGNYSEVSMSVDSNEYQYYQLFLRAGSSIEYNYNTTGGIQFYIFDGHNAYLWDQGSSFTALASKSESQTTNVNGVVNIYTAQDYYMLWYNDGTPDITQKVNFTINYSAANEYELSVGYEYGEDNTHYSGDFTVPYAGNWYFFIYFDPFNSPEEYTDITFDVTYETGVTAQERWISIAPILIGILVVIAIIVVAAVIARKSQKKLKPDSDTQKTAATKKTTTEAKKTLTKTVLSTQKCSRCGSENTSTAHYCVICGGKLSGRQIQTKEIVTPAESKKCSLCGSKLEPDDKFCKFCGTEIEHGS